MEKELEIVVLEEGGFPVILGVQLLEHYHSGPLCEWINNVAIA